MKKYFASPIRTLLIVLVIYLVIFAFLYVDFSAPLRAILTLFKLDFSRFFPTEQKEFAVTPIIYSFFLLIIPFFSYVLAYIKFLLNINYFLSYLFHWYRLKKHLKMFDQHVFNEENMDVDVDVSGNFYFANMIVYDYILMLLAILPCGFILAAYYISLSWEDLGMEAEDEDDQGKSRIYDSLETSILDEHYYKHQLSEIDVFQYHRTEREIKDIQEESLEYVMEDEDLEEGAESLDFLETLSQTVSNLIFNRVYNFLPTPIVNFFKFINTELALKNLLIFLLYFPCFLYIIFKYFFRFLKRLLFKK